jgi:hypothetical protein
LKAKRKEREREKKRNRKSKKKKKDKTKYGESWAAKGFRPVNNTPSVPPMSSSLPIFASDWQVTDK